jgi:hypothetical protein
VPRPAATSQKHRAGRAGSPFWFGRRRSKSRGAARSGAYSEFLSSRRESTGRRFSHNREQRVGGVATVALAVAQNMEFAFGEAEGHLVQQARFHARGGD